MWPCFASSSPARHFLDSCPPTLRSTPHKMHALVSWPSAKLDCASFLVPTPAASQIVLLLHTQLYSCCHVSLHSHWFATNPIWPNTKVNPDSWTTASVSATGNLQESRRAPVRLRRPGGAGRELRRVGRQRLQAAPGHASLHRAAGHPLRRRHQLVARPLSHCGRHVRPRSCREC